mgnify:CR=1 FL=1
MLSRNIAAIAAVALTTSLFAAPADYIKDVKPILAEHCYRCHGASQQKSGMRADTDVALEQARTDGNNSLAPYRTRRLRARIIARQLPRSPSWPPATGACSGESRAG